MVERKIELKRRYHRKKKMAKLKARLAKAGADTKERDKVLVKIRLLSPWWTEPGKVSGQQSSPQAAKPTGKAKK